MKIFPLVKISSDCLWSFLELFVSELKLYFAGAIIFVP